MVMACKFLSVILVVGFQLNCMTAAFADVAKNKNDAASKGTIQVSSTGDRIEKNSIAIQYDLSTREVFARQFLEIRYQIRSNDAYITLFATAPSRSGQEFVSLPVRKSIRGNTDKWKYQYEMKVLFATSRPGKSNLDIPELSYSVGGKEKARFQFAKQAISVMALPPYLPPYIPMGEIRVTSGLSAKSTWYQPYNVGSIYYWNITVTGENITSDAVPEIRHQTRSSRRIRFLPAEVSRKTLKTADRLVQQVSYSIPFILKKSGLLTLPELRVQYFDTQKQRIQTSAFSMDTIFALHGYLKWLILTGVITLILWLVWRLMPFAIKFVGKLRHLHDARLQLKKAITPAEAREAMRSLGVAFGWPENLTLSQWYERWNKNFSGDANLSVMVNSLRQTLYAPSKCEATCENLSRHILAAGYLGQFRACLVATVK